MKPTVEEAAERVLGGEDFGVEYLAVLVRDGLSPACADLREALREKSVAVREEIYGKDVFVRGLVEISSYCRNDCYYCGIRCGNRDASRYRLTEAQILACARDGYGLGFRTVVLQGGEDARFTDEVLCGIIGKIKAEFPDMAVTLSLGERRSGEGRPSSHGLGGAALRCDSAPRRSEGFESFRRLREAGADRYLLRHETADAVHYGKLHPVTMSFENRLRSLRDLRELGYQVGCGFMVGSPYQTPETLAQDLAFIRDFRPEMCGIGPFVPHHATPFAKEPGGTVEMTCFLLSLIRLLHPHVLLPATTALGTIDPQGREKGILAGANVVMPNLSPVAVRKQYELYDNKICTGEEAAECRGCLARRMESIGYRIVTDRGDYR